MVNAKWIGSPNFSTQNGIAKRHITLHWMVGTLSGTDSIFQNASRAVSTTYGIGRGEVHQYVAEKNYAYGDGNTYSNRYGISIEHEGGYLVNGVRVTPDATTHELSAQLCADISKRWGLGKLVVGKNVFGHSHWVSTACPGTLNIQAIVNRANEILGAGGAAPAETPGNSTSSGPGLYNGYRIVDIQTLLTRKGFATSVDGQYGPDTTAKVKAFQKASGLVADGVVGPLTWSALNSKSPTSPVVSKLIVDGIWGTQTTLALQRNLGVTADGVFGPNTIKALQRKLGVSADGVFGPNSKRALQRRVGAKADGIIGRQTVTLLQQKLNAGAF